MLPLIEFAVIGYQAGLPDDVRDRRVEQRDALLHLSIRDDGIGGADPAGGSGLIGLRDRVQALGGSIEVKSPPGEGTAIVVELQLQPD